MRSSLFVLQLLMMLKVPSPPQGAKAVPPRVKEVLEFLREVAPKDPSPGNYRFRKPINEGFFRDISAAGLLLSDVSPPAPGQLTIDQLRKVVRAEKGLAYRYLVGLALDASLCGDYSHLTVKREGESVRVVLSNFDLTFENEEGTLKLREVRSTDPGGD